MSPRIEASGISPENNFKEKDESFMNDDLGIDDADQESGMGADETEAEKGIENEPGAGDQVSAGVPEHS